MIFLYSKLDIQHKGEGLGNLQDFVEEPIVTWNASGYLEVEFKYFLYGDLAEHMIPDAKLKTRIHSNDEVYHLFTIYEVEPDYIENTVQVRAEMTLLHELKDRVVPAGTMRGTANEMIMFVKNKMDRDYPFVITGSTDRTVTIEHDNISAYELIFGEDGILKRTGAEIGFTDRGIRLSNRIGTIHRDELRESDFVSNLTVNELQGEDFVTRIIPFTTAMFDRPLRDGDRYIRETIETPTYGTPVVSPNINNKLYKVRTKFVEYRNEPTEVTKYYNYRTERGTETLEMSEYVYEDVTALNQDASTFFEDNIGIDEPTTTISIETLGLAKGYYTYLRYLNRYDIVTIYVEPKPYLTNNAETYVVQVNETVYEPLSDNLVSIGFTNESTSLQDAYRNVNEGRISGQQLQAELQRERLNDLEDRLVNYVYNHDGFRLEFGNVLPPPDEYREGDLYYLETGEGIDLYRLVNGAWEFLVGQSTREIIEGKIEEIEKQAQGLASDIEASDQKATEAKEEAGLAKSTVDAFGIITQETADKMVDVEQTVATAESNATDALAEASEAKTQASEAATRASEAETQAGQAVVDAQTAITNAREAQADSKTAIDNSSLAQTDAVTAMDNARLAQSDSKTAIDTASKAQTDANTAIDNASKAQTDAQTAIGNASLAQTDAQTAIENAQTALSTAGNADSKAGQAIAKANAIPTTITDIIADKNLVNGSYVDTKVDDATGAWSQELVRVEGKIPTEIGGRNLVLNTQGEHTPSLASGTVYTLPLTESGDFLGKEVTFSFKAKSSNGTNRMYISLGNGGQTRSNITGNIVIPKEYKEFKYTFTAHTAVDTTKLMIVTGTVWHPDNEGSITVTDIKLEKGNIATDWSPAPEDFYSQEEFKLFNAQYTQDVEGMTGRLTTVENGKLDGSTFQTFKQAEYQVTADKVASTMSRVDTAEGKITTQGTAISQQATAIASKADKTVVDTLSGTVSNQGTLISQNATDISSKAETELVNEIKGTVDTHTTEISQNATAITSKASQKEFDTVKGTVGTHTTTLSQHATSISSKADKSLVDTLSGTVTNQGTAISQNATDIASKANTATVNTLTGRVDTAESSISQNATAISQRVTTTTYNTGLATKENNVLKQSTAPTHLNGRLWLDTSVTPNVLKRSTGTTWVKATPTTASEVGAYSSGQGSALAGRVTTAETNITQTSEAITSKADKSVVDTLSGKVTTHGTTLTQHADSISSKAEQSEVDTVKGTVSTHTSTLSQHAKDISARLTQSQVNSLVSDKGYSTVSYVDNQMSATAEGIRTEMTAIEGKIPTYIGGRNYLINTHGEYINDNSTNSIKLWDIADVEELRGQVVTFSFELKSSSASNGFYASVSKRTQSTIFSIINEATSPTEYKKYEITFEFPMDETSATIMIVSRIGNFPNNIGLTTFRKLKLEKGSVATDWSPAPEDMMEQSDFDTFKAEYEQSAKGWSSKLLEIEQADYATQTWSNQTFATPQSVTTQLTSYAKSTDLNGLATETYVSNQMSATAEGIRTEMTAIEGKIPTEIGMRNLLKNSKPDEPINKSDYVVAYFHLTEKPVVGETYTFVLKGELAPTKTRFAIYNSGGAIHLSTLVKDGDYYVGTFTWKNTVGTNTASDTFISLYHATSTQIGTSTVEWATLIKGDAVMKDWSPAPEDMMQQNDFSTFEAEYEQSAKGWNAKLLQIEQANYATQTWSNQTFATPQSVSTQLASYAKTTDLNGLVTETSLTNKNYITSGAVNTLLGSYAKTTALNGMVTETTLANKNFATASSVNTLLTSYAKTTDLNGLATESYVGNQMSATAKAIRTEMTAVENKIPTHIGGRNLVLNTQDEHESEIAGGSLYRPRLSESGDFLGKELTLSFKAKSSNGTNKMYVSIGVGGGTIDRIAYDITIPKEYTDFKYTFTSSPNDRTNELLIVTGTTWHPNNSGSITVKDIKLETGNVATDWTPAPEDMLQQSDFNSFKATYEQSAKGWNAKLLEVEQAGYATQTWSNQTFATPQSVNTQLSSYAKSTDLNGLVTETALANKSYITSSAVNTLLTSYAKTTALNGLATESYVGTQINTTAKGIRTEITAVEGLIEGLEIGGRNLVKDSGVERKLKPSVSNNIRYDLAKDIDYLNGEEVTLSFEAKTDVNGTVVEVYPRKNAQYAGFTILKEFPLTTDYKRYSYTWTYDFDRTYRAENLFFRTSQTNDIDIREVQIEKGNKATDWTPAPEDMMNQSDFNTFKAEYDQSASGWSSKLLQIEQANYATRTWSNQTFATPQSVSTQLQSYAKTTALNGMVTETTLANKNFITASSVNTLLSSYAKTTALNGMVTETTLANKNFATASSVTTQLQSYAKTTDLNGLATESYVGSQLSATAGTIRSEITAVENKIPTQIGGRNLVLDTQGGREYGLPASTVNRLPLTESGDFLGKEVTLSFKAKSSNGTNRMYISLGNGGSTRTMITGNITIPKEYKEFKYTFTASTYEDTNTLMIVTGTSWHPNNAGSITVTDIKMEKGKVATDWTPAPEDMATSKQVSSIKQTADSIQTLVGTTNDSVARAVMTSNLWETEVSKVIDDELEQEYKNVESYVPFYELTTSRSLLEGERSTAIYLPLDADNTVDGKRVVVDIQYEVTAGSKGNHASYIQYGDIKSSEPILYTSLNTARYFMFVPAGTRNGNIMDLHTNIVNPVNYTWAKLTNITVSTIENTQVPVNGTNTGAISSKITQLYDMINLSVLGKDGALSRIAMGEEGIQIDGKLLHITAKTFIDDAVIKSAMIDTINAGKITTGELNAANVSIVNLDVDKLTGNTFDFIKGAFTSSSSRVNITGDGLDIVRIDGSRVIELDSQGIGITGQSGKKMGRIGHLADGGYGEETVAVASAYNTDLVLGYQSTSGNTYTPAIKVAKNTGSIRVSESTTFAQPVYIDGTFYLGTMRMSGGTGSVSGVNTANLAFPSTGGQLRVANGDLYVKGSNGSYYSFMTLWNKAFS